MRAGCLYAMGGHALLPVAKAGAFMLRPSTPAFSDAHLVLWGRGHGLLPSLLIYAC